MQVRRFRYEIMNGQEIKLLGSKHAAVIALEEGSVVVV